MNSSKEFWNNIIDELLALEQPLIVNKFDQEGNPVPGISESGVFYRSIGEYHGQIGDWRASIPNGQRGIHALEYKDFYKLHIDKYDPKKNPTGHLLHDSPGTLILMFLSILFLVPLLRKRRLPPLF